MAKRDRRGTILSKSKARRVKKTAAGRRPAKSMGSGPDQAKKRPARTPDSGLAGPNRAPRHSVVSQQRPQSAVPIAGASTQRIATAKLIRNLPSTPARSVAGVATRGGQSTREFRTPLPSPTARRAGRNKPFRRAVQSTKSQHSTAGRFHSVRGRRCHTTRQQQETNAATAPDTWRARGNRPLWRAGKRWAGREEGGQEKTKRYASLPTKAANSNISRTFCTTLISLNSAVRSWVPAAPWKKLRRAQEKFVIRLRFFARCCLF